MESYDEVKKLRITLEIRMGKWETDREINTESKEEGRRRKCVSERE